MSTRNGCEAFDQIINEPGTDNNEESNATNDRSQIREINMTQGVVQPNM